MSESVRLMLIERLRARSSQICSVLAVHGITQPRISNRVSNHWVHPTVIPVELFVDIAGAHDWTTADLIPLEKELSQLVGHPILLVPASHAGWLMGETEQVVKLEEMIN